MTINAFTVGVKLVEARADAIAASAQDQRYAHVAESLTGALEQLRSLADPDWFTHAGEARAIAALNAAGISGGDNLANWFSAFAALQAA